MSFYFTKDGAPFIPESINPDLVKISRAIIKNCHLKVKYQMKTAALQSALKSAKTEQMKDSVLKCIEKNKLSYNQDMTLTGVKITEIDDSFFDNKDDEFYKSTLALLIDFAAVNTVVDTGLINLLASLCESQTGVKLNKTLFFTNQTEVLDDDSDEDDEESQSEE